MKNLKTIREKQGYTQKEFAKICEIATSTYNQYETGKRQPDLETLQIIANNLNVTIDEIISGEKERPTENGELLKENTVIFHRDGKTVTKEFTPEQMELIAKLLAEIPGETKEN